MKKSILIALLVLFTISSVNAYDTQLVYHYENGEVHKGFVNVVPLDKHNLNLKLDSSTNIGTCYNDGRCYFGSVQENRPVTRVLTKTPEVLSVNVMFGERYGFN